MNIKKEILTRILLVNASLGILAIAIFVQIINLILIEGDEWREKDKSFRPRELVIEPNRGDILACDGRKLATSIPMYAIYMDFKADGLKKDKSLFSSQVDSLALCLAKFFKDQTKNSYKKKLIRGWKKGARYFKISPRLITYTELQKVKKFPLFRLSQNKGGVIFNKLDRRTRPFDMIAARTIGKLYGDKTKGGMVGIEEAFDVELQGIPGISTRRYTTGGWRTVPEVEPQDGFDIMTSLDVNIQDVAERALLDQLKRHNADHGCAVLMEVATGEIRAIANLKRQQNGRYTEDYFNFAIGERADPGSTFKLASMIVALEDGYIDLNDTIETGNGVRYYYGTPIRDSHRGGFGRISVKQVFEKSSNVGISSIINQYYGKNPERFIERLYAMHLNQSLNIPIKGEKAPFIRFPGQEGWSGLSLPWMSIGYETEFTPLQILSFYNAIANEGKMVKPKFVKGIYYHGEKVQEFPTEVVSNSICSRETIDKVKLMLEGVVQNGTARNLRNAAYNIAGKTGTAQIAKEGLGYKEGGVEYRSSFCGYFPADNPKYSCIVVVTNPTRSGFYGNVVAGTVFKAVSDIVYAQNLHIQDTPPKTKPNYLTRIPYSKNGRKEDLKYVLEHLDIPVSDLHPNSEYVWTKAGKDRVSMGKLGVADKLIPNVMGMGARDALYLLENADLKVVVSGRGRVNFMSLQPGNRVKRGQTITIRLS